MIIALYVILTVIALFILLMAIAPKTYNVNRTIIIHRPVTEVFSFLKYIKNQDQWSPWKKKDPHMRQTYTGTDGEVGFIARWEGTKDVGTGEQEIKRIIENRRIETELRFLKPWRSQSDAYITVDPLDQDKTAVTWGFSGVNKVPANIFFLFFNMDKTVGADFEDGLKGLKIILERNM
jgi:hypothetical protein